MGIGSFRLKVNGMNIEITNVMAKGERRFLIYDDLTI
jgi:hypothetical protein